MHIATKLFLIGTFATLTGCSALSSLNPFSDNSASRNKPAALIDFKPAFAVRTAWSVPVGSAGIFAFSPSLSGDSIYAAAADGTLVRLNAATGREVWRINAGRKLTAGVGSNIDTIAVAGEKGAVMAFDTTGKPRWTAQASSEILAAPVIGQGLVIVRSVDNRITAFDADSGARRWISQRTAPSLTLRNAAGITIVPPVAFAGLPGGRLLALALNNGAPIWEVPVSDPRGATELERIADVSGTPVVWGREICAAAYQGRVACFDAVTGAPRWAKDLSSDVGVAMDERFVFVADEHGVMNAFSRESGASAWRNDKLANRRLSTPVSFGRSVAVGDGQGYVHFLSREDGSFLARAGTDGSAITGASQVDRAHVIFQTRSGTVVALATE